MMYKQKTIKINPSLIRSIQDHMDLGLLVNEQVKAGYIVIVEEGKKMSTRFELT